MKISLSVIWYIASILIIFSSIKYSYKYKFIQLNLKEIFASLKSKSKNNISPISSLCISLAAKIGVGSLSGIALAIYFGGVGAILWIVIISLIISINTYIECNIGIKYRERVGNTYLGGPSYYIKKCLHNNYLAYLYSILILITYSFLFLSIQTNTIISTTSYFNIKNIYIILILALLSLVIIIKGLKVITKINTILVPIMLLVYFSLGLCVTIKNINLLPVITINVFKEALNIKSFIPVFLIGMQRAIFITESSIGTSAISASICDNHPKKQGMLEVFGIYISIFIVSLTTFIIITTSNYQMMNFKVTSGIDLILYAFKYHFGKFGTISLAIITILFALSTMISSYYFGENNLIFLTKKKKYQLIYKIGYLLIIITSIYFKPLMLWKLTDYFLAFLAIINVSSILKIMK